MSKNTKQTSAQLASLASATLKNPDASKTAKSLAASVMAQRHTDKQTGPQMEDLAAVVLDSSKFNADTKSLAASVLSQANKER